MIIPYFVDTREQELAAKIIEEYNVESVKSISSINEIEL